VRDLEPLRRALVRHAWPIWLAERRRIGNSTRETYKQYFRPLERLLGSKRLDEITIEDINRYQEDRRAEIEAWRRKKRQPAAICPGASRINHEVASLARILDRADLWAPLKRFYEPMPLPREGPGIALTEEEETHLFNVAQRKKRWLVAYCCHLISVSTAAGPGEIRHIQLRSIDLVANVLHIEEGYKNRFRIRAVPFGDDARWALQRLVERYDRAMQKAGIAPSPDHFLLYHRAHQLGAQPDPTQPMGSWHRAHRALRAEAGKKFPRLLKLRRVDLRHTGATKMLEDPDISYSAIERMLGHKLGSRTKQIYDHVRDPAMRRAAERLDGGHTAGHRAVEITERKPPTTARNLAGNPMTRKGFHDYALDTDGLKR
jgi:integrase